MKHTHSRTRLLASLAALLLGCAVHAQEQAKLKAGSDAPDIGGLTIISGSEADFASALDAKVTVVEFWATWCPPCRAAIPHLNELYKTYKPKGLQVIGVSTDQKRDPVDPFVRQKGDAMSYLVGWDGGDVAKNWMEAAGQKGIPCTFIVANKKIVWIGNPHDGKFDRTLRSVVMGRYDPVATPKAEPLMQAAREAAQKGNYAEAGRHYDAAIELNSTALFDAAIDKYRMLAEMKKDPAAAKAWATTCLDTYAGSPRELTDLAGYLALSPDLADHDLATAQQLADKAVEASSGSDAEALAVLARIQFLRGDAEGAYATQRKAFRVASPELKEQLKSDLDGYKAARAKAAVGG